MRTDRIQIGYTLTFKTPFHCGTGIREGLIDRTVVKDGQGFLYVPGSTFKGVLRERCEQLARMFEELDEDMRNLIADPHVEKAALRGFGSTTTMITRIFGSHIQPGHLYFDDARQTETEKSEYDDKSDIRYGKGKYKNLQFDLYTQVRLDRVTRTAVPGALYTSEFGLKDLEFHGDIMGWLECTPINDQADIPTYSLLLLLAGLRMIDRLGGNKSTGKGQCECAITSVTVGKKAYDESQWQSWFNELDALSYYSSAVIAQEGEA
jgi:CRISPR/Cas system CSM-associated protein Csm3 (group 7 of RAMP superfamily)